MTHAPGANPAAETAAAQLKRILLALPALADDKAHALSEVAERAGTDEHTLLRDLRTLVTRNFDEPAGYVEPVQLALDARSVRLDAPGFFRRPMGLSVLELEALELGLAMLRQETPAEEHATIDRARDRLHRAISSIASDGDATLVRAAQLGAAEGRGGELQTIQRCVAEHRVAELTYRGARDSEPHIRLVRPFGMVHARGSWYAVAWCLRDDGLRVFRLDRVVAARETDQTFDAPADFRLDSVLHGGRVVSSEAEESVTIEYSGRIARWIEEREQGAARTDEGSVRVEYPLHSEPWAVRHVLQYGSEARIVGPDAVRARVVSVLRSLQP